MRLIDADALKEEFYQKMKELLASTDTPSISNEALSLLCGAALITNAPTIEPQTRQWTPCSEQLPEDGTKGITLYSNGKISGGIYLGDRIWDIDFADSNKSTKIIAWMPLPEPYKEVNHE